MGVHKAAPAVFSEPELQGSPPVCGTCHLAIKSVTGGRGPMWVHSATGMVAGPGGPRQPASGQSDAPLNRYRINDALRALASEMGADLEDDALDELTHHVAEVLEKARPV